MARKKKSESGSEIVELDEALTILGDNELVRDEAYEEVVERFALDEPLSEPETLDAHTEEPLPENPCDNCEKPCDACEPVGVVLEPGEPVEGAGKAHRPSQTTRKFNSTRRNMSRRAQKYLHPSRSKH